MMLKSIYDVTITTLAPLHIGSGHELQRDYDYVTHDGKTWVMESSLFLEHLQQPDGSFDERILGRPASELLESKDFQPDNDFFRYVIPGQPRARGYGAVVQECLKNSYDCPYIPGSSVKGALRTILAWHGFKAADLELDVDSIRSGRSWAGQGLERKIFGRNPNYDLLRALHVADSQPQTQETLQLTNAQVVTGAQELGSPVELEAIRQDTVFTTQFVVDQFLHTPAAESKLHFGSKWQWLADLPTLARQWAQEQLQHEREWHHQRDYHHVERLYDGMLSILDHKRLADNQFFLQIGWGGGWQSKTIGYPLQEDESEWERLLSNRRLSPARMRRRRGDPFPKSRRVAVVGQHIVAPFGWCLAEMSKRK